MNKNVNRNMNMNENAYVNRLLRMDRDKLIDLIISQNTMISEQSKNMVDLIDLTNDMSKQVRTNTNSYQDEYDKCMKLNEQKDYNLTYYQSITNIQIVLFIILIAILIYLIVTI